MAAYPFTMVAHISTFQGTSVWPLSVMVSWIWFSAVGGTTLMTLEVGSYDPAPLHASNTAQAVHSPVENGTLPVPIWSPTVALPFVGFRPD